MFGHRKHYVKLIRWLTRLVQCERTKLIDYLKYSVTKRSPVYLGTALVCTSKNGSANEDANKSEPNTVKN
ncbi:hypothetical protein AWA1501_09280 [Lactiplantibacillus pentosus]|nr:hypothetical protein AWA1501_09280 [Lactiplantibacillus pentosus]